MSPSLAEIQKRYGGDGCRGRDHISTSTKATHGSPKQGHCNDYKVEAQPTARDSKAATVAQPDPYSLERYLQARDRYEKLLAVGNGTKLIQSEEGEAKSRSAKKRA
ncbi:hypothetical protein Slin15195_G075380 [Septoria linicola]|uniref:Uncharacterized protein n=1 Tax=Septoria linicola TaxID=215465 RepID=A0A9Q9AT69_9PEZI|nr:hypothetical protein Slin14017_G036470 [Septoria linicola]USW54219.1 hypothetical protein Slin15195_G075380 [Septoria linicola]